MLAVVCVYYSWLIMHFCRSTASVPHLVPRGSVGSGCCFLPTELAVGDFIGWSLVGGLHFSSCPSDRQVTGGDGITNVFKCKSQNDLSGTVHTHTHVL